MWQADMGRHARTHPAGGVAPSSHDLALRIYVEKTAAHRRMTLSKTAFPNITAGLRRAALRLTRMAP